MGILDCPKHGLQGIAFVCHHLQQIDHILPDVIAPIYINFCSYYLCEICQSIQEVQEVQTYLNTLDRVALEQLEPDYIAFEEYSENSEKILQVIGKTTSTCFQCLHGRMR